MVPKACKGGYNKTTNNIHGTENVHNNKLITFMEMHYTPVHMELQVICNVFVSAMEAKLDTTFNNFQTVVEK